MPVVNQALIRAGCRHIDSIITTLTQAATPAACATDERGQILAYSDHGGRCSRCGTTAQQATWKSCCAIAMRGAQLWQQLSRFLAEKTGDLGSVDSLFEALTGARLCGQVVPVSLQPAELCFRTAASGAPIAAGTILDRLRTSDDRVADYRLEPEVTASDEALAAR